jgi:hypothetical protein
MALTQVDANQLNTNVFGVVGPFRNRFINGGMQIAQRATSATVTAGTAVPTASTGYPSVDRWYVYSTGANVTAAQVAGSGAVKNRLQITGAASVTAIGVGQRIEVANSYDLAGSNATLGVDLANSLLTTVTWTAYYATTADTFGTVGTPTKTQIATGTFTVTSSVTRYTANIAIPAAATTGVEVVFTVGAQISGTWTIGNVQLELGLVSSTFESRSYGAELALCQRYYETFGPGGSGGSSTNAAAQAIGFKFQVAKRASPTINHLANYTLLIPGTSSHTATATGSSVVSTTGLNAGVTVSVAPGTSGFAIVYYSGAENISASAEL